MDEGVYLTKEEAVWLLHQLLELMEATHESGTFSILRADWLNEMQLFAQVVALRLRTKGGGGNPDLN